MTYKKGLLTLLTAGFILIPQSVQAQAERGSNSQSHDPMQIYKDAGIDSQQEARIRQMVKDFETSAKVRLERSRNLLRQMQELSFDPNPAEDKVMSLQETINNLQSETATQRIKLMLQIRHTLTPEQRFRLVSIMRQQSGLDQSKNQTTSK